MSIGFMETVITRSGLRDSNLPCFEFAQNLPKALQIP